MNNTMMQPAFGCASWGWREWELPRYFEKMATLGFTAVEINAHSGAPKHLLYEPRPEVLEQISQWAEQAGLKILCIAGRNNFTAQDEAELTTQIDNVRWFIDAAVALNAPFVRLLSGGHREDSPPPEFFSSLHYAFNTVGDYAHSKGIKITIENHGGPTATGQRIVKIMQGISSPAVGLNYDPANFLNQGTDPLMALRYILPWVNYSHWKDVYWQEGPQFCAFGEGEIVWKPIIQTLLNSGYQGYWVVEYENPQDVERGTATSLENLRNMLLGMRGADD